MGHRTFGQYQPLGAYFPTRQNSCFSCQYRAGGAQPPVQAIIVFIDDQRGVHGVEPICKVLPIAPSTYFDHQAKRADPDFLSDRAKRDALLLPEIKRVHKAHFEVRGAQKLWRQLGREGFSVARCTVARLMRANGIEGAVRGRPLRTTFSDKAAPCPRDHVNQEFQASVPNPLWVSDFIGHAWSYFPSR